MLKKKKSKDVSSEEIKGDANLKKRAVRSKDDVKTLFVDNYIKKNKLDPKDENVQSLVNDLAERELANSKRLSKVLKQKINYREQFQAVSKKKEEKKDKEEEEAEEEGDDDDADDNKHSGFAEFKSIERDKAAVEVIKKIIKDHPDEGLSYDGVYENIREVYVEKKTDTSREDFKKRIRIAFQNAYPTLYEDEIKSTERKRLAEDENDDSQHKDYKDKKEHDPVRRNRSVKILDWYKG